MAIFSKTTKSGKIRYYLDYREPDGRRRRKVFDTKREARREEAEIKSLMNKGQYFSVKQAMEHQLGELMTAYHETFKDQAAFKTHKVCTLPIIAEFFGCEVVSEAGRAVYRGGPQLIQFGLLEVERFRNWRLSVPLKSGKPRAKSSVNRDVTLIQHMLSKAVQWGWIDKNPLNGVKDLRYKEPKGRTRYLTEDEAAKLIRACPAHLKDVVVCTLHTGMRTQEVLGLRWEDIRHGLIHLRKTKSGQSRQVPINDDLARLLKNIRGKHGLKSEFVFLDRTGAKQLQSVKKQFRRACVRAGLEVEGPNKVTFHTLRDTFATHYGHRTKDARALQQILGHHSLAQTEKYLHVIEGTLSESVQALNGFASAVG